MEGSEYFTGSPLSAPEVASQRPAVIACNPCRLKHQKCYGGSPCLRCLDSSQVCTYSKSRRGNQGPRRRKLPRVDTLPEGQSNLGNESYETLSLHISSNSPRREKHSISDAFCLDPTLLSSSIFPAEWMTGSSLQTFEISGEISTARSNPLSASCSPLEFPISAVLSSYYHYCHPSHPFLPPESLLQELLSTKSLRYLDSAIRYRVACSTPRPAKNFIIAQNIVDEIISIFTDQQYESTDGPYMLQALLLLVVATGSQGYSDRSWMLLAAVQKLAVQLDLNSSDFAIKYGEGNPVLEDCWRRTWWEAYIIDTLQSGIHRWKTPLNEVEVDVLVPSDPEGDSAVQAISLRDLDNILFYSPRSNISNYAYRVDAARLFNRVLTRYRDAFFTPNIVQTLDAAIVTRVLSFSWVERTVTRDLEINGLLAQARMLLATATIMLHSPPFFGLDAVLSHPGIRTTTSSKNCTDIVLRSETDNSYFEGVTHPPSRIDRACRLTAAKGIMRVLSIVVSPPQHFTPFTSCFITLAFTVLFSEWTSVSLLGFSSCGSSGGFDSEEDLKEQMKFCVAVLREHSEIWPITALGLEGIEKLLNGAHVN